MKIHIYVNDATAEQVAKVRRLYERPGTPGEKEAARQALLRYGVDPEHNFPPQNSSNSSEQTFNIHMRNRASGKSIGPRLTTVTIKAKNAFEAGEKADAWLRKKYPGTSWEREV